MSINTKFFPINNRDISLLQKSRQIFSDCYLTSTLNSLTRNDSGKNLLKQNIQKSLNSDIYKIHFPGSPEKPQDIFVTETEINNLVLTDKYANIINHGFEENSIQKAVELAMNKLIQKYPRIKSLICRYADSVENFEYNFPSEFMSIFTGKQPTVINEKSLRMSLKSKQKQVFEILEEINNSNGDFNFVAGTGFKRKSEFDDWHCFTVQDVNLKNNSITLYNTRICSSTVLNINIFIDKFKYLAGYIN